ncbi:reactive intermediate/imine deaminase [Heyndrickxia shackletonii]|uniref:Reactive intermediate/imine deaminase n=1 Tax=Heyndrickxia shackletonii TaxID=157838 RepID=A0A0Q3TMM5_9BACI|nr:Rid family detoxifying hydrolase [Heyndrickxia shackletonii]KQL55246.1 reactive intermediate/imine deaminase [Heyndrickxia shackletonii]NEY98772.1 RidA family protein [Heyndrickxia shackletonii]
MRKAYDAKGAVTSGPYSHAVEAGGTVYLSGQTPINPATGEMIKGDIGEQTRQCFRNLFAVLDAAELNPDHVVKVNVYLTDMKNFSAMNEVYETQFAKPFPARTTVAVLELPLGAEVEIEMIAKRP